MFRFLLIPVVTVVIGAFQEFDYHFVRRKQVGVKGIQNCICSVCDIDNILQFHTLPLHKSFIIFKTILK